MQAKVRELPTFTMRHKNGNNTVIYIGIKKCLFSDVVTVYTKSIVAPIGTICIETQSYYPAHRDRLGTQLLLQSQFALQYQLKRCQRCLVAY